MRLIKRILLLAIIVIVAAASIVIGQGYQMYLDAVEEISVEEKAAEIMEKEHYTTYD